MSAHRSFACLAALSALMLGCGNEPWDGIELPEAPHARAVKAPELGPYPTLTIAADGTVRLDGILFDGFMEDDSALIQALGARAREMPMVPRWEGADERIVVPGNPVLIRADRAAPFGVVKRVIMSCDDLVVWIWRLRIAASAGELDGALEIDLTRDKGTWCVEDLPYAHYLATLDCPSGASVHIWRMGYGLEGESEATFEIRTADLAELTNYLESHSVEGPGARWSLDAPDKTHWGDIVTAMDAFVGAGLRWLVPIARVPAEAIEARSR